MSKRKKPGRPKGTSTGGAVAFTDAEVSRLKKVSRAISHRDFAYVCFLLGTGARVAEPLQLTIGDCIDAGGKVLACIPLDKHQTKSRESRHLWLSNSAQKALQAFVEAELLAGAEKKRPLFVGRLNKPLNANWAAQRIGFLIKEAGIKGKSSHSARKYFAQSLLENGTDLVHIQKLLGHASLATTQKYLRSTDKQLANAVGLLKF